MYDFDKPVNRRRPDAYKWMVGEDELPMWVADMDFETAPEIRAAIAERAAHGVFGYGDVPREWYDAYANWWETRHGLRLRAPENELIFCTGVIPAISSAVRKLTTPAEKIAVLTPVYNIFFNSILNNGRIPCPVPLLYERGRYSIDLPRLEAALADPQTSMLIFCNPHNPVGRVWNRRELAAVGELAQKHGITVLSDEIHCDLTKPGRRYTPFFAAGEACRSVGVTCIAPTKAFNLAGLQTAAVLCFDRRLQQKMRRALNTDEVAEPNAFAVPAAVAAFTKGGAWLDALRDYLWRNRETAEAFLKKELPRAKPVRAEATYLLWLDCTAYGYDGDLAEHIRRTSGLVVTEGSVFGAPPGFLRINLACPRETILDGMERLKKSLDLLN